MIAQVTIYLPVVEGKTGVIHAAARQPPSLQGAQLAPETLLRQGDLVGGVLARPGKVRLGGAHLLAEDPLAVAQRLATQTLGEVHRRMNHFVRGSLASFALLAERGELARPYAKELEGATVVGAVSHPKEHALPRDVFDYDGHGFLRLFCKRRNDTSLASEVMLL